MDKGVSPSSIGVFYRVNALSRVLEEAFETVHPLMPFMEA
jgi:hypothetical protein